MKSVAGQDRVLYTALALSLIIHVSMVTLFRIVILFPRPELVYYDLSIVEREAPPTFSPELGESLEVPSSSDALARREGEDTSDTRWTGLPPVTLPRLNFSELELIRISQTGLGTRSRYNDLFEEESNDLWSRFGRKISTVGNLLSGSESSEPSRPTRSQKMFVGRPAPGFEAYLEWMSAPYDRKLLMMGKIDALWSADPKSLKEPLVLVLRVNPEGRVTFVQMPLDDEAGLMEESAASMFQNLFEALDDSDADIQHATIIIQAGDRRL
jgi:hypothetical protein